MSAEGAKSKKCSRSRVNRLLEAELGLEEALAILSKAIYELSDDERKLLCATRPIRHPSDVLSGAVGNLDHHFRTLFAG